MGNETRKTALEKLFGKKTADAMREGLRGAEDKLDELGVERKALDPDALTVVVVGRPEGVTPTRPASDG